MFAYKRRVTFYETDGMQVVHHANYLRFMEEARVEYFRAGGLELNDLMEEEIVFPIVEVSVKYHKPARYDDILVVKAYLRRLDRARFDFDYEIINEKTGDLLITGHTVNTYTDRKTGRIVRLPKERLEKLFELSEEDRKNG